MATIFQEINFHKYLSVFDHINTDWFIRMMDVYNNSLAIQCNFEAKAAPQSAPPCANMRCNDDTMVNQANV